MANYGLVDREHLQQIANKLKEYGYSGELKFPGGFIAAIDWLALQTPDTPVEPEISTETLILNFTTGDRVSSSNDDGTYTYYDDYVCVGHSSSKIKNDAVWSFTPTINASNATVTLQWDNSIGSVGWPYEYDYKFEITTDGTSGQNLTSNAKTVALTGVSGTATITFNNLNLQAGVQYYIRANYSNYTSNQTLKAFKRADGAITITT